MHLHGRKLADVAAARITGADLFDMQRQQTLRHAERRRGQHERHGGRAR